MTTITQINGSEIIEALSMCGVKCEELWIDGSKWGYHDGFLEGESKWCLRLYVDADDRFKSVESLRGFYVRGRHCIPPVAAMEYLACAGYLPPGEYLVWCSW